MIIQPGRYFVGETWSLTAPDSGSVESQIAYRADAPGVALVGGRQLPSDAFVPLTDAAILTRLVPEARDAIRIFNLRDAGITELGAFPNRFENAPPLPELFFNGERMTLARWPNDDWATIASIVESGPAPWRNHASDKL
ncbi:MAG: hypothetical protein KJ060_11900, partial [Candidatus Hydrogenedentes bacterium]|nr:hypothetical protein [Candidatus Hydrogenedentota bacterium]